MICYNPDIHNRHSIRLREYDYSQMGAYFVTICTQNRECLFGNIVDGKVILNDAGRMVESIWNELPQHYKGVETDEFIVMPNHFHGIIVLVGAGLALPRIDTTIRHNQGAASSAPTLGDIVRTFKSKSTIYVNRLLVRTGQRLWQRNYYEHIIRTEDELNRLREYIIDNPTQWAFDNENPDCIEQSKERRTTKRGLRCYVGADPCACPVNGKSHKEDGQPRGVVPTQI
jgi:REP element-mobilizing transposase RayT